MQNTDYLPVMKKRAKMSGMKWKKRMQMLIFSPSLLLIIANFARLCSIHIFCFSVSLTQTYRTRLQVQITPNHTAKTTTLFLIKQYVCWRIIRPFQYLARIHLTSIALFKNLKQLYESNCRMLNFNLLFLRFCRIKQYLVWRDHSKFANY